MKLTLLLFLWCAGEVHAQSARDPASISAIPPLSNESADKSRDTLFHPTPKKFMRAFSSDRPGSTNSFQTIDAGHFQVETELTNYSSLESGGAVTRSLNYPAPSIRVGLTESWEASVAWTTFVSKTVSTPGSPDQKISGLGDVSLFVKKNLSGNEGGDYGWGFMVGVKMPTNTHSVGNRLFEPTVMIPIAFNAGDWNISLMPEVDFRKNGADDSLHTEFNTPFTVGHSLGGIFEGYVEVVTHSSSEVGSAMTSYFGTGLAAKVEDDVQLDLDCNLGLNAATPQVTVFGGWTFRH